jgi:hypothetical protein
MLASTTTILARFFVEPDAGAGAVHTITVIRPISFTLLSATFECPQAFAEEFPFLGNDFATF